MIPLVGSHRRTGGADAATAGAAGAAAAGNAAVAGVLPRLLQVATTAAEVVAVVHNNNDNSKNMIIQNVKSATNIIQEVLVIVGIGMMKMNPRRRVQTWSPAPTVSTRTGMCYLLSTALVFP